MTFDFLWYGHICALVAVAILEECCMAFANMQKLFLSGEQIVAHVPLVLNCPTKQGIRVVPKLKN